MGEWVNGRGSDYSAQHHHLTDYVFWLLSQDSHWMPSSVKDFLILGMREWSAWNLDLTRNDIWDHDVASKIYERARRLMRWPKSLRSGLEATVSLSPGRLGIREDPGAIATAFIDYDFTGALYDLYERRRKRTQRRNSENL
jgi:hypothetical protein